MAKEAEKDTKVEDINEEVLEEKDPLVTEEEDNDKDNEEVQAKDKEKELEEANSQLLRLQADFMNFKKRSERDKQDTINYALREFVCTLLPILDNFKIAMESETHKEDGFYDGVNLIYKQLIDTLKTNDVIEMEALGKDFDPNFHHAVIMEESDEYEAGKVIEVLQTGYLLKEKVIRPAMVKVAK